MKGTRNLTLLIILGIVIILGAWSCSGYNGLVKQDEDVKKSWNNVQSAYQRRTDLIPNLVNTVKGEANFEQSTLTGIVEARAKATQVTIDPSNITPEKLQQFQQAQAGVTSALGRLLAVAENYPTLRTNDGFRALQAELAGTENRINVSRNDFNDAVNTYNTKARSFPTNIFAGMFGFHVKEGFKSEAGSEKAPEVKF